MEQLVSSRNLYQGKHNGIWAITFLLATIGTYFLLRRNPRKLYYLQRLNGPKSYPVVGAALSFMRAPSGYIPMINNWVSDYGKVFGVWLTNFFPYVFIADPSVVEKVISTTNHIDKSQDYDLLHNWLGTGLLTASRNKWSGRRKLLTPSFHFKILEDFIPIFNEQASIFVKCLEKEADNGKSFNIHNYINKCTLDVICETAMGIKINAQTSTKNKKYVDSVEGICSVIVEKVVHPWKRVPILQHLFSATWKERKYLKVLKGFTQEVIQSRKLERQQDAHLHKENDEKENVSNVGLYGKKRRAFLDLLLDTSENGEFLTDSDIGEEVDTFMFEGHDTTGVHLGWTLLTMGSNPECQKTLQEELDEIFADDPERDVTVADIAKMKYLDCCIKETLRLYPSVPFIMRKVDFDIPLENENMIPSGCIAILPIYHIHRNENYFPQPELFKPERFLLNSNSRKLHPYSYIPFSAGPRNCIGQKFALLQEKITLAKLLRKYEIKTDAHKIGKILAVPDIVLRCENGIHVFLHKRR